MREEQECKEKITGNHRETIRGSLLISCIIFRGQSPKKKWASLTCKSLSPSPWQPCKSPFASLVSLTLLRQHHTDIWRHHSARTVSSLASQLWTQVARQWERVVSLTPNSSRWQRANENGSFTFPLSNTFNLQMKASRKSRRVAECHCNGLKTQKQALNPDQEHYKLSQHKHSAGQRGSVVAD